MHNKNIGEGDKPPSFFMDLIKVDEIAGILVMTKRHVAERITKQKGFPSPYCFGGAKSRRWERSEFFAWLKKQKVRQN